MGDMTENLQVDVPQSSQAVFVRCCLNTSKQTADKLADILRENKAGRWQGFDKTNKRVCDGHGFGIDVTFTDGSRLYAHGYMRYPLGYRGLVDAVESLFETLFEME